MLFIKINIQAGEIKKDIIVKDNNIYVNGNQKNIDAQNFVSRLFCIISAWQEKMIGQRTTNDYIYTIEIENNSEYAKIMGINKFPSNFSEFTKLLSEVGVWKHYDIMV